MGWIPEDPDGVWIVYSYSDYGYHSVTPFLDELLARRHADAVGHLDVKFVEFGEELHW